VSSPRAVIVTGGGTGIGAASYVNGAVIPVDGSATAVDVGTVPFDPRIEIRPT